MYKDVIPWVGYPYTVYNIFKNWKTEVAHYMGLIKYIIKTSVKRSKTQAPLAPDNLKGLLEKHPAFH